MKLKDCLITTQTIVHKMVVDLAQGTAVGLVETVYYRPKFVGGTRIHGVSLTCICRDIYRNQLIWSDTSGMDDLLPKYNTAKSLSRRLRNEMNKLVAEGKISGESIIRNANRQSIA